MKYFLDTNIIIYALNGRYSSIPARFARVPSVSIAVPSIVLAEIEYGARKSTDYEKTIALYRRFLKPFEIVPSSEKAARYYGIIRADLEKRGCLIGPNDMEIAATAIAEKATLVTHNTKEFSRIPGLDIEDWAETEDPDD